MSQRRKKASLHFGPFNMQYFLERSSNDRLHRTRVSFRRVSPATPFPVQTRQQPSCGEVAQARFATLAHLAQRSADRFDNSPCICLDDTFCRHLIGIGNSCTEGALQPLLASVLVCDRGLFDVPFNVDLLIKNTGRSSTSLLRSAPSHRRARSTFRRWGIIPDLWLRCPLCPSTAWTGLMRDGNRDKTAGVGLRLSQTVRCLPSVFWKPDERRRRRLPARSASSLGPCNRNG